MVDAVKERETLLWIYRVAGRWKAAVMALVLFQMALAGLGILSAWLFRDMIDNATGGLPGPFTVSVTALILAHFLLLALRAAVRFLREAALSGVENRFRERLFSALLTKSYGRVSAVHSGEWMNRLSSDAEVTAAGVVDIVPDVAGMLARIAGAMILLIAILPELAVFLIPGGGLLMLLTWAFRGKLKRLHKEQQEAGGRVRIHFLEHLSSLLILHSFSREGQAAQAANERMEEHRRVRMRRNRFANLCGTGFGAAMDGAYLTGSVYCAWRILRGTMSYGTLVLVMNLVGQVQAPFANITGYLPKFYAMIASAERLREAELWEEDLSGEQKSGEEIRKFYRDEFRGLALEKVWFSYRTRGDGTAVPVLRGVSLSVRRGEFVAFTGPSGCGKSTVLKLLLSVYPLEDGERRILTCQGAVPLTAVWRRLFAYVPQGNQLMAGTIREAVSFGGPADDGKIWEALSVACAAGFVRRLDAGLDTLLGEHGQGLSEGQTQRLAIARAIYSGHPVLLLDEATSSLDEETEAHVLYNLRRMTDCTVLIVTHRPAALAVCDRELRFSETGIRPRDGRKEGTS